MRHHFGLTLVRHFPPSMLVVAAVALAGCQTTPPVSSKDYEKNNASAVNIGSLSAAIAQSPGDANAYNVRGTARSEERL